MVHFVFAIWAFPSFLIIVALLTAAVNELHPDGVWTWVCRVIFPLIGCLVGSYFSPLIVAQPLVKSRRFMAHTTMFGLCVLYYGAIFYQFFAFAEHGKAFLDTGKAIEPWLAALQTILFLIFPAYFSMREKER